MTIDENITFIVYVTDVFLLLYPLCCYPSNNSKQRLPHNMENVCLGVDDDSHMYAVGSKAHTDLLDARTLQVINFTLLESIISIYFEIGFKNVELQRN